MILLILESLIPVIGLLTVIALATGLVLDFTVRVTGDQSLCERSPGERNRPLVTPRSQVPH